MGDKPGYVQSEDINVREVIRSVDEVEMAADLPVPVMLTLVKSYKTFD